MSRPSHLGLLAKAYGKVGQVEEGLGALAEAFAVVDKTGECCLEAELYRLKGELVLQSKVQGPKSRRVQSLGFNVQRCQTPAPSTWHPNGVRGRSIFSQGR